MSNAVWRVPAVAVGAPLLMLGLLVAWRSGLLRAGEWPDWTADAPAVPGGGEAGLLLVPYWGLPR